MATRSRVTEIIRLADDIARVATDIAQSRALDVSFEDDQFCSADGNTESVDRIIAEFEIIYRLRREREHLFDMPGLFSEPSWDILIDLFISHLKGKNISSTSVAIASCAPVSTALRWIAILEKEDLVRREADPNDGRRYFVILTDKAIKKLMQFYRLKINAG